MCTYVTSTTPVSGSGYAGDDWFPVDRAVVYFDHPQDAPLDHALCIDIWSRDPGGAGAGAPAGRIAVELDPTTARALAESILATLAHDEVKPLL